MSFVAALNALWMVLGLLALAGTLHTVLRRKDSERSAPRWLLVVGVGLIVAALFPYISASDDVLRIDHDQTQQAGHQHKHKTDNLMRLYEAMEMSVICRIQPLVIGFTFLALVLVFAVREVVRIAPSIAGRSPPAFLIPSQA